jgi:hypothetical protein
MIYLCIQPLNHRPLFFLIPNKKENYKIIKKMLNDFDVEFFSDKILSQISFFTSLRKTKTPNIINQGHFNIKHRSFIIC